MPRLKTALFVIVLIGLTASTASALENGVMSVQVKKGEIRSTPSFLGRIIARLSYGDQVAVLKEQGPWLRVKVSESTTEGWMHASALTHEQIVLQAGAQDVQAAVSSDELALAGKGFNEQVEGQFKADNPQVDFTWIDRMEKFVVSQKEMKKFLQRGKLTPQGGM
jgi:hypothetical protein